LTTVACATFAASAEQGEACSLTAGCVYHPRQFLIGDVGTLAIALALLIGRGDADVLAIFVAHFLGHRLIPDAGIARYEPADFFLRPE
jgi:hypothetical protein